MFAVFKGNKTNINLILFKMKTQNELLELIFNAVKLETTNNFIIKHNVSFSFLHDGLLSFSLTFEHNETRVKKIDFLFNPSTISENEVQSYYWQLNLFLERHFK